MVETPEIVVTVESRDSRGSSEAGRMRNQGMVPAVVYGGDKPPYAIAVEEHSIRELLKGAAGETRYLFPGGPNPTCNWHRAWPYAPGHVQRFR